MEKYQKTIQLILGHLALATGIVGIVLPLLPTTPLIILAAYFYSKSSPLWHQKIIDHKRLGPVVQKWEEEGAISLKGKILATFMITFLFSLTIYLTTLPIALKISLVLIAFAIIFFILTRPHGN